MPRSILLYAYPLPVYSLVTNVAIGSVSPSGESVMIRAFTMIRTLAPAYERSNQRSEISPFPCERLSIARTREARNVAAFNYLISKKSMRDGRWTASETTSPSSLRGMTRAIVLRKKVTIKIKG